MSKTYMQRTFLCLDGPFNGERINATLESDFPDGYVLPDAETQNAWSEPVLVFKGE